VVGSGTGGTLTANLLAGKLRSQIHRGEVTLQLLGENEQHIFQPGNLEVAFHGVTPESLEKDQTKLVRREVAFAHDAAAKIDLDNRVVTTKAGRKLGYDYLVLATGSVADPTLIPGLREGSLNFHTGPRESTTIWRTLQTFGGGKVLVLIASTPHKCPPSPNEGAFMLDEFFRRRGIRQKVELRFLTPYPRAYPSAPIADTVEPLFEKRGIEVTTFFNLSYVDPAERRVYSLEGEEFDYDLLIAVPPHRGSNVISESGIGDSEGWIPTDRRSMNVKDYDEVFALGDATNIPISKSGVVAHLQSTVVASNIVSALSGSGEKFEYNGRINCPMELGYRKAIFVSATYTKPPEQPKPSTINYIMKKAFSKIYWLTLSGRIEWLFDMYFGETSYRVPSQRASALGEQGLKVAA